jgi:hypothetical protein
MNLAYHTKVFQVAQSTTATAANVAIEVDMVGWDGCYFLGVAGSTATTAHTMTISTAASTTASFVALTGATKATTAGNDFAVVDVVRPRKRWLKGTFSSTANSEKFMVAIQYAPRNLNTSSTYDTIVISPDT